MPVARMVSSETAGAPGSGVMTFGPQGLGSVAPARDLCGRRAYSAAMAGRSTGAAIASAPAATALTMLW